jgi:hypothetical protein
MASTEDCGQKRTAVITAARTCCQAAVPHVVVETQLVTCRNGLVAAAVDAAIRTK